MSPRHSAEVIEAATSCVAAGLDKPALCELAGESPKESSFVLGALIEQTLEQLGMREVLELDLEVAAATAMIRRFTDGLISARELASWAHRVVGHGGSDSLQPFVELDDHYDLLGVDATTKSDLESIAIAAADAFLKERPSLFPDVPVIGRQ